MHRVLQGSLLAALALAFSVTACGGGSPTAPPPASAPPGTWVELEPITVGTITGNTNAGNTFPFGSTPSSTFASTTYQQVYAGGQIGSTQVRLTRLDFFVRNPTQNTAVVSGEYTFSISTTSRQVDGLETTNFQSNVGPDARTVFAGTLGAGSIVGDLLAISFTAPFAFSPSGGNLLLNIGRTNAGPRPSSPAGMVNHTPNDGFPRGLSSRTSDYGNGHAGFYLVTRFHRQHCVCPTAAPCTCPP